MLLECEQITVQHWLNMDKNVEMVQIQKLLYSNGFFNLLFDKEKRSHASHPHSHDNLPNLHLK